MFWTGARVTARSALNFDPAIDLPVITSVGGGWNIFGGAFIFEASIRRVGINPISTTKVGTIHSNRNGRNVSESFEHRLGNGILMTGGKAC